MDAKAEAAIVAKRAAGYKAADLIKDGMIVGLGTGSTVYYMIERLAERIRKEHLTVQGIPTSFQTALRARESGILLTTLDDYPEIDIAIDGADEVDPAFRLIKGRGAAHLREKCVAAAAKKFIVVVDETKIVKKLGTAVPVEVLPFAITPVLLQLQGLGGKPVIREAVKKDGPVITDNGNIIVDCTFGRIDNPGDLEAEIAAIPGVVESGLFTRYSGKTTVIIGGIKKVTVKNSPDVVA